MSAASTSPSTPATAEVTRSSLTRLMLPALLITHTLHLLSQVVHGIRDGCLRLRLTPLALILKVELSHGFSDSSSR